MLKLVDGLAGTQHARRIDASHLNDGARGLPAHVMDGVLVAQPVGAFYLRIKHYEPLERAWTLKKLTVSYICHRQSSSVMFYTGGYKLQRKTEYNITYTECGIDTTLDSYAMSY